MVWWFPFVRPSAWPLRPGLRPPVFDTFLLHALTNWTSNLHMILFLCTTYQVWVPSLCVNVWRSYASFVTQNIGNTPFSARFSYMLWHIELKFCIWLFLMYQRSSWSVISLPQVLKELCSLLNLEYRKCAVFRTFLLDALTYWAEIVHCEFVLNIPHIRFECRNFASIFEGVMRLL